MIQDDALPAPNFVPALERIAATNPDVPVCLFLGGLPADTATRARRAMIRGKIRYVPLGAAAFVPLVCVLWPRAKAEELLEWSESARGLTRADDGNVAKWVRRTKQRFLAAVPSLVQHDDDQPSVKGGRSHVPWAESWRKALFLADDCASFDW